MVAMHSTQTWVHALGICKWWSVH